jgi:4-hydroxythreonine-4-phosphate dehydrogenase
VLHVGSSAADLPPGRLSEIAGRASYRYLETAVRLAVDGTAAAVCTAPINKEAWRMAGIPHPGHTEALAALTGTARYAMMLVNRALRVIHLSTHKSLVQAARDLSAQRCVDCVRLTDAALRTRFDIANPRIAVAGLNPHAGENGLLGSEDRDQLAPAVAQLAAEAVNVSGPWPPDTIFARAAAGEFDAVIAAYHDQGHIPIKMLGLDTGVNVTLGLPILRTSVDHGTAFDIAGSGRARGENLLAAIDLAQQLAGKEMS